MILYGESRIFKLDKDHKINRRVLHVGDNIEKWIKIIRELYTRTELEDTQQRPTGEEDFFIGDSQVG